ncbi:MAG: hypothetical protein KDA24_20660 [Deltaproteobacteria bacterium]|nr:hypothetical protein [Deltaproteobacteria bacterium]
MGSLFELFDPARTWALWLQGPLLVLVLAATAGDVRRAWGASGAQWMAVCAAGTVVLGVFALAPWGSVPWSGHEDHYRELLLGLDAEPGSLESTNTFPFPAGIAWAGGQVLDGPLAVTLWRIGNRVALGLALLAMGVAAGLLVVESRLQRWAALLAVLGGALSVPLLGWSTTAFGVAPALLLGAIGLCLALRGRTAAAIAWTALAFATRMEWAGGLVAVVALGLAARAPVRESDEGRETTLTVAVAALVVGAEGLFYATKHGGLPGVPNPGIALENVSNIPLGGPWFGWLALLCAGLLLALAPPRWLVLDGTDQPAPGRRIAYAVGLLCVFGQLGTIVDLGARHLVPATLLLVPAVAASAVRDRRPPEGVAGAAFRRINFASAALSVLAFALLAGFASDAADLRWRIVDEHRPGVLPRQARAADEGGAVALDELDDDCIIVLPGGESVRRGAWDAFDVGNVRYAHQEQARGACVQWAVQVEVRFAGDTRLEFLDRAVRTLSLEPVGWMVGPAERWLLLEAR